MHLRLILVSRKPFAVIFKPLCLRLNHLALVLLKTNDWIRANQNAEHAHGAVTTRVVVRGLWRE